MHSYLPTINLKEEKRRIVSFLKKTFQEQGIENAVIGLSGGIDSAVSFSLLKEALPPENIIVAHMYYKQSLLPHIQKLITSANIPSQNIYHLSIKPAVAEVTQLLQIEEEDEKNKIRRGNIAARMRMIILFDLAKKHHALVCGTENKSENVLSYFTRFGDQASDIEPIEHLYKTYIYQLAEFLKLPQAFISKSPSAGLWQGQTDEEEFGFTYAEADQVLFLHVEQGLTAQEIIKKGFPNTEKILAWRKSNLFKHNTPYTL